MTTIEILFKELKELSQDEELKLSYEEVGYGLIDDEYHEVPYFTDFKRVPIIDFGYIYEDLCIEPDILCTYEEVGIDEYEKCLTDELAYLIMECKNDLGLE